MRLEVSKKYRHIRLWTNSRHSYCLSFKGKYQVWWVALIEEWWATESETQYATVIRAR